MNGVHEFLRGAERMDKQKSVPDCATEAIQFALRTEDGLTFLRLWNEGEFDIIRREWPEAPKAIFVGADPLLTVIDVAADQVSVPRETFDAALRYIQHCGANQVARGQPHPQQWLVDAMLAAVQEKPNEDA